MVLFYKSVFIKSSKRENLFLSKGFAAHIEFYQALCAYAPVIQMSCNYHHYPGSFRSIVHGWQIIVELALLRLKKRRVKTVSLHYTRT
jgi:hypothetical protein